MKLQMVATCLFGLEKLLGEEIDALGCRRIETMDGRITFEGDERQLAAANICLRLAERVYIKLGSFEAKSFDSLFEGVKSLPWEQFIGRYDAFPVDVWIKRAMQRYFPEGDFTPKIFGDYAGIAQQYLFYYERYLGGQG